MRRLCAFAAVTALALGLGACSGGTPTVDRAEVEEQVSAELEKEVGVAPDDISCPDDLTGEVGETMRCTLTAGEDELGVSLEVTEVDGEDVRFSIEVDEMDEQS